MAYRQYNQAYRPNRNSVRGGFIEDIISQQEIQEQREKEKYLAEDTNQRKNLNQSVVNLVLQEWPADQIEIAVKREFKDENPNKIKKAIVHWQEQTEEVRKKLDAIKGKLKDGRITKTEAYSSMKFLCMRYNLLKSEIQRNYEKIMEELEEER